MNDYLTHATKIQYFGHLMWRADSLGKTLMLGKIEGGGEGDDRGWDGWMASPILWMWVWVNSRSWWWTGRPGVLQFMGSQRVGHGWATELNQNLWTHKHGVVSGDPGRLCRKVSANSIHITGRVGCKQYKGPSGKHTSKCISVSWMWWLIQLARAKGPFVKKDQNRKINCFYTGKSL